MQNQYNNYLKRQKQPINNFKEKVINSLNGKTVNNTTMPNTSQAKIQNKVKAMTPTTGTSTNTVGSGSASGVSTPIQTPSNINSRAITPNTSQTPLNASEGTPVITTPVEANQTQPTNIEGGAGLMSLSDVNSALAVTPETTSGYSVNSNARGIDAGANQRSLVYNPLDPNAIVPGTGGMTQAEYEAEAKRKLDAGIALDNPELYNKYTNQSTPYKLADQILQSQKEQANKGWQLQEQMFQQQQEALKKQHEQSKLEAENAYKQSVDTLNEQKYNQMEELNVSGTNRGIQYSPQQLGLENVANINHNKNLVETSNKRNELLNKLQIEMNNSLAQLNMGHLQNYNDYQNKLNGYQTDYFEKLMNWNREDNKTQDNRDWEQKLLEEKRAWEEAQAQKDKEFQQMMQELQNKFDKEQQDSQNNWQSGENKLDRDHDKEMSNMSRSGGGYSRGGYSRRGYSGYSRSYNPYSRGSYGGYQNYDGGSVDMSDDINARAYIATVNDYSDDAFNAYNSLKSPYNADARASAYRSEVDEMINFAKKNGADDDTMRNLYNTRDRAVKQMFENHSGYKNYGGDAIKRGDDKVKFYQKHVTNSLDRMKANQAESIMKKMRSTKKEDKVKTSKQNNTKQNKNVEKVKKSVSNSAKNLKKNTNTKEASKRTQKAIANSKKNVNKSLNNAKKNVKKSVANSKKNVKKSTNNAMKNLKKNIGKLFGKK
nr:MAG TPA: hypothetical protein [Caudoviricetes sp.]